MRNHARNFTILLLLMLVAVCLSPVSAQDSGTPPRRVNSHATRQASSANATLPDPTFDPNTTVLPGFVPAARTNSSTRPGQAQAFATSKPTGTITALVILNGAPALAGGVGGAGASAAAISANQSSVSRSLSSIGKIQVRDMLRYTANALVVTMDASQIDAVKALPGVKDVVPDQIGQLDNAHSVPFIKAVAAWEANGGNTGVGIKIGIIDSGIDYTHTNFGGTGDLSHYNGQDSTDISDIGFDGSKVISGFDFVGDGWSASLDFQGNGGSPLGSTWHFDQGDNDPLDCNGHGSHVAGTAAGFGVNSDGTTFTGPWDNTVPFDTMRIGPGVAPQADLYALKIGDCSTSVSFIAAALALEYAVDPNNDGNFDDHLDVVNNSYGSSYGTPLEILDSQYDFAAQAGVVVVVSAGNSGDTYFVNGNSSTADWAISTASSVNDTIYNGLQIDSGPDGAFSSYPAVIAAKLSLNGALGTYGSYTLKMVGGGNSSVGCSASDFDGFAGEAGLILWVDGGCSTSVRMTNAVNHGGVSGLVFASTGNTNFPFINPGCSFNGGPSPIPCVAITATDGVTLANNPSAFTVTFDSSLQAPLGVSIADELSGFSSRGPVMEGGTGLVVLKPDITAPGDAIFSTEAGSGNQGVTEGGTSMAAPHITGSVALMRQLHPTWTVAQIKALLMNTATHDLFTEPNMSGDNYGVSRVGAGRVDLANALNSDVVAYGADVPERVSLSFGLVEVVDTVSLTKQVTVQNNGATAETYDVSFQQANDTPGAQFSASPAQVTVPAGGTATVDVTFTANKANMANANVPDPTTPTTQVGVFGALPRERIMEEGGYVVLTSTGSASKLRVPVHAVPRPSADMKANGSLVIGQNDKGFAYLPLTGKDVFTGVNFPDDIISEVTALQVVGTDPISEPTELGSGDIQYVGVSSDYLSQLAGCNGDTTCAVNNTTVYVGLSVYGQWSTATSWDTSFNIGFDSNEDDTYDASVFNFDTAFLGTGNSFNDTMLAWVTDGGSWFIDGGNPITGSFLNGYDPGYLETYVFENNVLVFPVRATRLGLNAGNTDFQFDVNALSSLYFADWVPATAPFWYTYDIAHPAYEFGDATGQAGGPYPGIPMWDDLSGNLIPVGYDLTGLATPPQILLLHHHNAKDAAVGRAEVVDVERVDDPTLRVDNVYDNNGVSMSDNPVVGTQINDVHVKFNMPVKEGTGPDGVANPDNFRLLGQGSPGGFQTNACYNPVDGGDTQLPFGISSYDAANHVLTLHLPDALPEGQYRVMVCGSTSIVDARGIPLDGNGDQTPGDDAIIDFEVNYATGVTAPTVNVATGNAGANAGTGAAGANGTLTAEQLAAMQLPATGETPAWQPLLPLSAAALAAVVIGGGFVVYRRRRSQS